MTLGSITLSKRSDFGMMFYTQLFTSKRDSLAKIWLAAHWERKVTKAHVFDCNLERTIKEIISTKIKIGLRTSGHLLIGVVRIYSRKTKYLLADCSDAMVKINVSFRPGITDLPVDGLEAAIQSITLIEDFTDFDAQLPDPKEIGVVDNFSLNQSRTEEITLKEDFGNDFLSLVDFGDNSQCHMRGILDMRLSHHGDSFGDEKIGYDLIDFMAKINDDRESMDFITEVPLNEMPETPLKNIQPIDDIQRDPTEAVNDVLSEATPLTNEEECFALEPVAITPSTERKRGKRRRRLMVDQTKELSDMDIREQIADASDLCGPLDMAPPTAQQMQWKERGGALSLFGRFSSTGISSQLRQLFTQSIFGLGNGGAAEESDLMRKDKQKVQDRENTSIFSTDTTGLVELPEIAEITMENAEHSPDNTNGSLKTPREDAMWEVSHPQLPSEEDSMVVHPTGLAHGSESDTAIHTQPMPGSQDEEEKKMTKRVEKLLYKLKAQSTDTFSLQALCEGETRMRVAATFFCLLLLRKEQAVDLRQGAPYGDVTVTPGPRFHHL